MNSFDKQQLHHGGMTLQSSEATLVSIRDKLFRKTEVIKTLGNQFAFWRCIVYFRSVSF
jgi:hypothetical protein